MDLTCMIRGCGQSAFDFYNARIVCEDCYSELTGEYFDLRDAVMGTAKRIYNNTIGRL